MNRRGFLRGTFGGAVAGGIVIATGLPDSKEFVESVKVGDPVAAAHFDTTDPPEYGEMVFNKAGVCIGFITDIKVETEILDASLGWYPNDGFKHFVPGLRSATATVVLTVGFPTVTVRHG